MVGVGSAIVSRIIDVEDVVSSISSQENPVTATVDVGDNAMTTIKTVYELLHSRDLLSTVHETELVHSTPDDQVALSVASVSGEPVVEGSGVVSFAAAVQVHRDGAHGTSDLADRGSRSSDAVSTPAAIALLVQDPVAGLGGVEDGEITGDRITLDLGEAVHVGSPFLLRGFLPDICPKHGAPQKEGESEGIFG